ncbi:hypothetical protein BD414DRAFT_495016 [Trametes punicea]|nr:hypothetical protein BD414DRAFT_495016 [Trametes punicea]
MILPDDTPASPAKSRTGPPSESADEEYIAPPPAYPGHGSSGPSDLEAQAGPSQIPLNRPGHHIEQVEPAFRRFLKAFGIAVLVWLFVGSLARSMYATFHWRIYPPRGQKGGDHGSRYPGLPEPYPTDGNVEHCVPASSGVQVQSLSAVSALSFDLPLSADALYIFSRGALSRGSISFVPMVNPLGPHDRLKVDITITYGEKAALDKVNICLLERYPWQKGIGILTPSAERYLDILSFNIAVRFPVSRHGRPLEIRAFETDLPFFEHTLSGLSGIVRFDSISLSTRNAPLHARDLAAAEANLTTVNAHITGTYNITRSIFLRSSNEAIDVDVSLYDNDYTRRDATLTIVNKNAPIDARLAMHSRLASDSLYSIVAHTTNSPLSLSVHSQPPASTLLLDASTSNAPASVALPHTYEGDVQALTSNGHAEVVCGTNAPDPTGNGRRYVCEMTEITAGSVKGWKGWGVKGSDGGSGNVSVVSKNGRVKIVSA